MEPTNWRCHRCTFINVSSTTCCVICSTQRSDRTNLILGVELPKRSDRNFAPSAPMQQSPSTQQTVELQIEPQSTEEAAPLNIRTDDGELPAAQTMNESIKGGDGCFKSCRDSPHGKAWCFTFVVLLFILCWVFCSNTMMLRLSCDCDCGYGDSYDAECRQDDIDNCDRDNVDCYFPCRFIYPLGYGIFAFIGAAYFLYFIECVGCSSSIKYLSNIHDKESIYQYIERVQSYPPRIWWKVECYHYETRHHSSGGEHGGSSSSQEKVVTHRASANYEYASWKDVSAAMTGLNEYKLTKLTNSKMFSFANAETKNDYFCKMAEFRRKNDRDKHQKCASGFVIKGFKEKMLVEVEPGTRSKTISLPCYLMSSFLLCTVCFRMYFASICGRKKYTFNKQINLY